MSLIATAVKHLLAAGVTGDALVAAIADMEAAQPKDRVAEKRRAYDRERKRVAKSTGIPPEPAETAETVPSPSFSPDPSNNPTPPCENTQPRVREARPFALPEGQGIDPDHWRDFLTNRKRKGLASTATAYRGQLASLDKLADDEWPPGRLVQHAAEKGWGSINDPREGTGDYRNGQRNAPDRMAGNRGPGSGHGRTVDAALDWVAGH